MCFSQAIQLQLEIVLVAAGSPWISVVHVVVSVSVHAATAATISVAASRGDVMVHRFLQLVHWTHSLSGRYHCGIMSANTLYFTVYGMLLSKQKQFCPNAQSRLHSPEDLVSLKLSK